MQEGALFALSFTRMGRDFALEIEISTLLLCQAWPFGIVEYRRGIALLGKDVH